MSKEEKDEEEKGNEGDQEEGEPEPEKEERLIIMQKGDYNVHILIEEVKNLIEIEEKTLPVPRVKMTVFGKDQRTSKMKKPCDSFVFNEHFYFDKTNLTVEMLDSEKILIEVYDNKHTKRKDYFGIYEIDFGYVYNQEDHAIHNIWIGLANPEAEKISQIRGYLKLSVSVLQESDPRIDLQPSDNDLSDCIIPSQIKMKYKQISLYFFKGEQFPDMDALVKAKKVERRCDGYIEVKYMGVCRKTKVVTMIKEEIVWNQIIDIPATKPAISQKICMVVKDQDEIGDDDIVGSVEINVDDIYAGYYNELKCLNIYGCPVNSDGGINDAMKNNAEIGSSWNGRILMKCEVKDVDSPIASVRDIPKDVIDGTSLNRNNIWKIKIRAISAMFLPKDHAKYKIKFKIQDKETYTQYQKAINGSISYNEVLTDLLINTFSDDKFELPDLFIYLVDEDKDPTKQNLCFQRIKADTFYLNKDIICIKLLPDPAVKKCKNMKDSGILICKIFLYHPQRDKDIPSEKEFKMGGVIPNLKTLTSKTSAIIEEDDLENLLGGDDKQEEPQPETQSISGFYTVVAIVYMSKGLVAAESNGTSDPFVTLTYGSNTLKTSVKNNTMNGIWNEKLQFNDVEMDLKDNTTWPVFLLSVYDYNKIKSDVPLGYNYIFLNNGAYTVNETTLREPKWHNLFLPKSNKQQGQILLSFYIFDSEHKHLINQIEFTPTVGFYNCEISILGLRQLKPLGMIEVKKPFIKFDLNSLNVTGKPEDAHANIQTVPVNGGANPTINTVIKFDTKLPLNPIFMPELQCEVYDHMLSGLHNSLLGVFSLDLKKLIKKTHKQIDEDILQTRKTVGTKIFSNFLKGSMDLNNAIPENPSTNGNQQQPFDIKNSNDPLSSMLNSSKNENKPIKKDSLHMPVDLEKLDDDSDKDSEDNFLEVDENKVEEKGEHINIDEEINKNKVEIAVPKAGEKLSSKNTIKLDGNFLKNNLNQSDYFVLYPNLKLYKIPGYELKPKNVEDADEKVQKEFLMEDISLAPSNKLYFEIGYLLKVQENIKPEETTKHYRRIYFSPLENVDVPEFKIKSPFNVQKIKRGKFIDKAQETTLFDAMRDVKAKIIYRYGQELVEDDRRSSVGSALSQVGFLGKSDKDEKSYGKFKGLIRIAEKGKMEQYEEEIKKREASGRINTMKNLNQYEKLRKKLITKESIIIRVYILELNELAKKDLLSESDPYIKILVNGKEMINEKDNYKEDQKNCKWYKYYDIPGEIPGSSTLKIEVWDWDEILSDDLIGSTVIDLEDRYYNEDWQKMRHKPVEVRPLLHPDLNGPQGKIYMWLEMFKTAEKTNYIPWKIDPQPLCEFQVRFIVWETEDMEMMDVEGTSDIYVIGYIDQKEMQKTDIHFRCQTGVASFNWRMLLPLRLPVQKPVLTLQVYDKDIFASDDYMCGTTFNLKNLINIPKFLELPVSLTRDFYHGLSIEEKKTFGEIEFLSKADDEDGTKFWAQCYKGKKEAMEQGEKSGRVMCSLEILPKSLADMDKVGKGRDEPNVNPYLPPPTGRLQFTLNPFKMMNQCVGAKFRRKCYCYCLCCLLVVYLAISLPTIFSGILV